MVLTFILNGPKIVTQPSSINRTIDLSHLVFNVEKPYLAAYTVEEGDHYIVLGLSLKNIGNMMAREVQIKGKIIRVVTKTDEEWNIKKGTFLDVESGKGVDLFPEQPTHFRMTIGFDVR